MYNVFLVGYYGFANTGDEAILASISDILRNADIRVTALSADPYNTEKDYGIEALSRNRSLEIIDKIGKADLVLAGGGGLFQDSTSQRSLFYYAGLMLLAKALGRKTGFYGQGVGPLQRSLSRSIVQFVAKRMDMITVRDSASRDDLISLGVNSPPILVSADPVFALNPSSPDRGEQILEELGVASEHLIGIAPRHLISQGRGELQEAIVRSLDYISERWKAHIIFIPMHFPYDEELCQRLSSRLRHKGLVLNRFYHPRDLMRLIGSLDLVIGMRLHSLIMAGVMGVPSVGLGYDPKVGRILSQLELEVLPLQDINADKLLEKIFATWDNKEEIKRKLRDKVSILRDRALEDGKRVLEILENKR